MFDVAASARRSRPPHNAKTRSLAAAVAPSAHRAAHRRACHGAVPRVCRVTSLELRELSRRSMPMSRNVDMLRRDMIASESARRRAARLPRPSRPTPHPCSLAEPRPSRLWIAWPSAAAAFVPPARRARARTHTHTHRFGWTSRGPGRCCSRRCGWCEERTGRGPVAGPEKEGRDMKRVM